MMLRWPRGWMLALALLGCSPDETSEPVAFGEVCGVDGPFRLIALDPDEVLGVDLDDGSERSIDLPVVRNSFAYSIVQGDDVISYQVVDGERSGLWLARLPPK